MKIWSFPQLNLQGDQYWVGRIHLLDMLCSDCENPYNTGFGHSFSSRVLCWRAIKDVGLAWWTQLPLASWLLELFEPLCQCERPWLVELLAWILGPHWENGLPALDPAQAFHCMSMRIHPHTSWVVLLTVLFFLYCHLTANKNRLQGSQTSP